MNIYKFRIFMIFRNKYEPNIISNFSVFSYKLMFLLVTDCKTLDIFGHISFLVSDCLVLVLFHEAARFGFAVLLSTVFTFFLENQTNKNMVIFHLIHSVFTYFLYLLQIHPLSLSLSFDLPDFLKFKHSTHALVQSNSFGKF